MQLKNLIGTENLLLGNGGIVPKRIGDTCLFAPFNVSKGTSEAAAHHHTFEIEEVKDGEYPAEPAKVVMKCFFCFVEVTAYDTKEVL